MGLDMYAFAAKTDAIGDKQVDFEVPRDVVSEEVHYWRKHHDLHGWMEALYRRKGGADPQFNCNTVRLMPDDLDALERAVKEEGAVLPVTTGFCFGNYPPDDDSRSDDLEFIDEARQYIEAGYVVWYDSWW